METLLLFGRSIAPFAIDCAVKISVAAIAALLAAHFLGRRQPSGSFACIVAAFGLAAVLLLARGYIRMDSQPRDSLASSETHPPAILPAEREPAAAPAMTTTPGLTAKYGSMFQIRISRHFPAGSQAPMNPPEANGTPWIPALGIIWISGFVALSAYHLLEILMVFRLLAKSRPCANRRLLHAAETVREILDARRAEVLVSPASRSAFVAGLVHPRIILPSEALAWPEERLTSTLLHEYMHVKRFDVPVAEGLRLLASLAWFSPFPWFAFSSALKLREEACDEAVLRAGIPRTAYATDLLDAARSLAQATWPAAAASISSGSNLEVRIRAILEGPVVRPCRDRLMRTAAATVLLVAAIGAAKIAGPLYSIPEFGSREALPQTPGEWVAAADPRRDVLPLQGAFSLSLEGEYARIRLRFRGQMSDIRLPAIAMPSTLPLSARARMIVPFGELVDGQSQKPFFNPGWSIWDNRQVPVLASASGRVVVDRIDPHYGPVIEVEHGDGLRTRYGLGRQGTSNVEMGEFVTTGTPLGTLGACSPYDLPTLNFSILVKVREELVALDPAPFLLASAENRGTPLSASIVNAAIRLEDRAELQRLIARGVSLNNPSADGTLPLEWALLTQNLSIAKDLLAAGADPQASTWNVHQAHIALHGPTVAELARDSANPAFAALLAPESSITSMGVFQ